MVIAGSASVFALWQAIGHRNPAWVCLSLFTAACATTTVTRAGVAAPGDAIYWIGIGSFAVALMSPLLAVWLSARPFLSIASTRRLARIGAAAVAMSIVSIAVQDLLLRGADPIPALTVVSLMVAVAAPSTLVVVAWLLIGSMNRLGRRAESVLVGGATAHLVIHMAALQAGDHNVGIWLAIAVSSSAIVAASRQPGAEALGRPLRSGIDTFAVQVWPCLLAGLLTLAGWYAAASDLSFGLSSALFVGSLVACGFAARELGGPRKPLVVPFTRRDRALQQLAPQLLSGTVRLIGRPVRRVTDGCVVGIEAEPSWSTTGGKHGSLAAVADQAGLDEWLHRLTVLSAQRHLPAVLSTLDSDEPFLSIPFESTLHPSDVDDDAVFDGLVLRLPGDGSGEIAHGVLEWQERGAMVQASGSTTSQPGPSGSAGHVLVDRDIVVVTDGERVPATSMGLARTADADHLGLLQEGVLYVVDLNQRTEALGVLLSVADRPGSEGLSANGDHAAPAISDPT